MKTKLNFQSVIDTFTPQMGIRYDAVCESCEEPAEETSSLLIPPPSIIFQVNKVPEVGNKAEIEISTNQTINIPVFNNPDGHQYYISDVIVHLGGETVNGQVTTYQPT